MEFLVKRKKKRSWKELLQSPVKLKVMIWWTTCFQTFFHWPTVWTICPSRDLDSWLTKHELLKNGLRLCWCYFTISTLNGEFSNTEKIDFNGRDINGWTLIWTHSLIDKHPVSQCLEITQIVSFKFFNFDIFHHFCPIKIDLSGNSVWLQTSGFQKLAKVLAFFIIFWLLKLLM